MQNKYYGFMKLIFFFDKSYFNKFIKSSIFSTSVHYSVFWIILANTPMHPTASSSFGYIAGSICSYLINYHYTFQCNKQHRKTIFTFYLMVASGLLMNGIIFYLLTHFVIFPFFLSQAIATVVVCIYNYKVSKNVVFKQ